MDMNQHSRVTNLKIPEDVAAGAEPLYDVSTDAWNGREVVQLKRFADRNYYLGKL